MSPSAGSLDLLCEAIQSVAVIVAADPLLDLRRRQLTLRLDDGTLAVDPLRLDRVEPRRLHRQVAGDDPHAPLGLRPAVVRLDPGPDPAADVPGGVVPDQEQGTLALGREPRARPGEEVLGDLA